MLFEVEVFSFLRMRLSGTNVTGLANNYGQMKVEKVNEKVAIRVRR